jgi:hypothetical protein
MPPTKSKVDLELVESAPDLELTKEALHQIVSWSSKGETPITLGEYIAAVGPPPIAEQLKSSFAAPKPEGAKRVLELSEDELEQVVCLRLRQGTPNLRVAVMGEGDYSIDDLIIEVKNRTSVGLRMMQATVRSIALVESLVDAGKLHLTDGSGPTKSPKSPDFRG